MCLAGAVAWGGQPVLGPSRSIDGKATGLVVGHDGDVVVRARSPVVDAAARFIRTSVVVGGGARENGQIVVAVREDGPGMTTTIAERAAIPGSGAPRWTGTPGAGGPGPALVHRLVSAAGGTGQARASPSSGKPR